MIKKCDDGWFYVSYMYDRQTKHWECDQIDGVITVLKNILKSVFFI